MFFLRRRGGEGEIANVHQRLKELNENK